MATSRAQLILLLCLTSSKLQGLLVRAATNPIVPASYVAFLYEGFLCNSNVAIIDLEESFCMDEHTDGPDRS